MTLLQLASVVESQCYPFAAHFLCSWGVACEKDEPLDSNGLPVLPCRDYCEEFMANCGHKLSRQIKDKLKCGGDWKGSGSCITKPGCVAKLYESGQKQRICDGVMDCVDFSDELHCSYCPPGNFHCGAGKECIPPEKKCDGVPNCSNGSDEKACRKDPRSVEICLRNMLILTSNIFSVSSSYSGSFVRGSRLRSPVLQ